MTTPDTGADGTFILTSGRSGSTLLARLVHTHPELTVVSDLLEPAVADPYFEPGLVVDGAEFWQLLSRPALPQRIAHWRRCGSPELLYLPDRDEDVSLLMAYTLPFLSGGDPWTLREKLREVLVARPAAPAPDHLLFVFRWLRDRFGGTTWVERTGGSLPHAAAIVETWPDARFVMLTRNPDDVARSMQTGSFFRLCLATEHHDADNWLDPRYADQAALRAMLDRWTEEADRAIADVPPDRLHRLTYEDLTADPADVLGDLAAFVLGRPPSDDDRAWAGTAATSRDLHRVPDTCCS